MRKIFLLILVLQVSFVFADSQKFNLNNLGQVLKITSNFADETCESVPLTSEQRSLQVAVQLKLNKFIRKFADVGINLNYVIAKTNGFNSQDLPKARDGRNACKDKLTNTVLSALLPNLYRATANPEKISFQDRLIRDQHPTKLVVDRFSIVNLLGSNESYVVAIIKNNSDVSAEKVMVHFFASSGVEVTDLSAVNTLYVPKNLTIKAGQEQIIPISPVSKYVSTIYPKILNSNLLDFSKIYISNITFDQQNTICKSSPQVTTANCSYTLKQVPTVVQLKYSSIFDEKITDIGLMVNVLAYDVKILE
jgi:hypothetical protein